MITVVESGGNFLISFYQVPKRDGTAKNEIIYTDKENNIAEHRNTIDEISTFIKINDQNNQYFKYVLPPYVIRQLYNKLVEIENAEVEPQEVDY